MPPARIHARSSFPRRPSDLIKPGIYGASPSPRAVTFAPNVTPGTYKDPDDLDLGDPDELALPVDAQLFPPSEQPSVPASKRRAPPGKRRSLGYIPRPPNAFMLFRADFVRQKHVPGSIETNHGSLSKIIGNCWRSLPLDEKRVWEIKAKQEKEAHSKRYPGYRFRPVHNKDKSKKKDKPLPTPEDERRCEEVAHLLLEGIKGDQLAAAIRKLDEKKAPVPAQAPQPFFYPPRRPSSVPLPDSRFHPITLPSVPFFNPSSRSASPVSNISRSARIIIGQRRPSSALPHFGRTSWGVDDIPMPLPTFPNLHDLFSPSSLEPDHSPLPMYDTTLFEESFNFGFPAPSGHHPAAASFDDIFANLAPHTATESPSFHLSPMDHLSPQDLALSLQSFSTHLVPSHPNTDMPPTWSNTLDLDPHSDSGPSSAYSGSPAPSDLGLPLVAPRPQHPAAGGIALDMWQDSVGCHAVPTQHPGVAVAGIDPSGLDMLFDGAFTGMNGL